MVAARSRGTFWAVLSNELRTKSPTCTTSESAQAAKRNTNGRDRNFIMLHIFPFTQRRLKPLLLENRIPILDERPVTRRIRQAVQHSIAEKPLAAVPLDGTER